MREKGAAGGAFFKGSQFFETTEGKVGADIDISGQGKSLAEVMGSSNGKTFFTMSGGALSGLLIEAAGELGVSVEAAPSAP